MTTRQAPSKGGKGKKSRKKEANRGIGLLRHLRYLMPTVLALATLSGLLSYLPRISVVPSFSLDNRNPMGTVFTLTNEGWFTVHAVKFGCLFNSIESQDGRFQITNIEFVAEPSSLGDIAPGGYMTIPCNRTVEMATKPGTEMTVDISYRPTFVWWRKRERFPFKGELSEDGQWHWAGLGNK